MNDKSLSKIYMFQGVLGALCSVMLLILAPRQLVSFLAGFGLITFEFYLLFLVWRRIFDKKSVATTTLLIITKYAVLGGLIYIISKQGRDQFIAFFAGVTTLLGSFLILALQIYISEKTKRKKHQNAL